MKKLSDYKDEAAVELWADLLEPLSNVLTDKKVSKVIKSRDTKINIARTILKSHSKEASEILLRIDDTPLDGLNIVLRLVNLITEIGQNEDVKSFFAYAEQAKTE